MGKHRKKVAIELYTKMASEIDTAEKILEDVGELIIKAKINSKWYEMLDTIESKLAVLRGKLEKEHKKDYPDTAKVFFKK